MFSVWTTDSCGYVGGQAAGATARLAHKNPLSPPSAAVEHLSRFGGHRLGSH